jgi:hypothetical protein
MMKRVHLKFVVLTLMLLVVAGNALPGAAAPARQATNLLQNPSFEPPYDGEGAANSWGRWFRQSESKDPECLTGYHFRPRWGNAIDFVYEGGSAQYVGNNWDTWAGGVLQTVSVTPGARYRFSFWARGRGAMEGAPEPSFTGLNMNIQAGIDPNGSGLWNDSDVVWGGAGSPHDQWQQFSVEATATGDKVTVFTAADWGVPGVNQCYKFLDTYYDKAELVAAAPPPTATSPPLPTLPPATATPVPPTNTPTPAVTATDTPIPTATPTLTPTPLTGGTICVNAFADDNANGLHDANEGYMAGVTFTIASGQEVAGQAISPGNDNPVCFEGIEPGSYQIAQLVPGRLEMTTAANTLLQVEEGKTYGVEFGSRLRPAETATASGEEVANVSGTPDTSTEPGAPSTGGETSANPDPGPGDNPGATSSLLTISGLAVLVLAVVMLGVLIFLTLRRAAS